MKAQLPHPQHYSYIKHRRQVTQQIILPVVIATGFERTGVPRRALERNPRTNEKSNSLLSPLPRQMESVNVTAEFKPSAGEQKPSSGSQPSINSDDLDVPTFLRNRT